MTCFKAWCAGTLLSSLPEQCMTFLVDYVSNFRQASCISYMYVDVLHVILTSDAQYLTLAYHVNADIICQQVHVLALYSRI